MGRPVERTAKGNRRRNGLNHKVWDRFQRLRPVPVQDKVKGRLPKEPPS